MALIDHTFTKSTDVNYLRQTLQGVESVSLPKFDAAQAFSDLSTLPNLPAIPQVTPDIAITQSASQQVAALRDGIANVIGSNSTSLDAALRKSPVADPLKTALGSGLPNGRQTFITNPVRGTIDDLDIGQSVLSGERLDGVNKRVLSAISQRFGVDVPTTDADYQNLTLLAGQVARSEAVQRAFTDFSSAADWTNPDLLDELGSIGDGIEDFVTYSKEKMGSVRNAASDVIDAVAKGFTSTVASVADAAGDAISAFNENLDPRVVDMLGTVASTAFGIAKDQICDTSHNYNYRNRMSLYRGLLNVAATQGFACGLAVLIQKGIDDDLWTSDVKRFVRQQSPMIARNGWADVIATIANTSPAGTLPEPLSLLKDLSRAGHDSYSSTYLDDIVTATGVTPKDVYRVNTFDDDDVWDESAVREADPDMADHLAGSSISGLVAKPYQYVELSTFRPYDLRGVKRHLPTSTKLPWLAE